jgi:hypothetical protein
MYSASRAAWLKRRGRRALCRPPLDERTWHLRAPPTSYVSASARVLHTLLLHSVAAATQTSVHLLSLTGKIMQWTVDRFVRQWDQQQTDGAAPKGVDQTHNKGEMLSRSWLV